MNINRAELTLDIQGMGVIFYSPEFAKHITEGSDYLTPNYTSEQQVQSHVQKGTIVGFDTGSSGRFILRFHTGYPDRSRVLACEFKLRLGLQCVGGVVCFRDLFDLLQWHSLCPERQQIELDEGIYHVTLLSDVPKSGILGDNQWIDVYFMKLDIFPALSMEGIPTLCM